MNQSKEPKSQKYFSQLSNLHSVFTVQRFLVNATNILCNGFLHFFIKRGSEVSYIFTLFILQDLSTLTSHCIQGWYISVKCSTSKRIIPLVYQRQRWNKQHQRPRWTRPKLMVKCLIGAPSSPPQYWQYHPLYYFRPLRLASWTRHMYFKVFYNHMFRYHTRTSPPNVLPFTISSTVQSTYFYSKSKNPSSEFQL